MKQLPLSGKIVVNTRPLHQSKSFSRKLEELGAEVLSLPAISLQPNLEDPSFSEAINNLQDYDWVIFTSVNGVSAFTQKLESEGQSLAELLKCSLGAIGPATRNALFAIGAKEVVMPDSYVSEEIIPCLGDVAGKRILLPRADIARKDMVPILESVGADVTSVSAYKIQLNDDSEVVSKLKSYPGKFRPDYLTFTSSSTVRGFYHLLQLAGRADWLNSSKLVAIGPITARTIEELGFSVAATAKDFTTDGIIEVLKEGREV